MFNNNPFNGWTIEGVPQIHPSIQRLYIAAKELRDVAGQSAVARLLGTSPQVVKNWEKRGISSEGALLAQKNIGADANWLLDGVEDVRIRRWTPPLEASTELDSSGSTVYMLKQPDDWPFRTVTKKEITGIPDFEKGQIEQFIRDKIQAVPIESLRQGGASN